MEAQLHAALDQCLRQGLTFAAFRRPGEAVNLWAQRTPELERLDGSLLWELNDVFLVAPFDLDPQQVPFIRSDIELTFSGLPPDIHRLNECTGSIPPSAARIATTAQEHFRRNVEEAKRSIGSGSLEKVVLSRAIGATLDRTRLPELFIRGLHAHDRALVALVNLPDHGTWLGASPEQLVMEEEDHVRVDATAGTMAGTGGPLPPSAWGTKERHEQELVTRHVRQTFEELGLRNVHTSDTEVLTAGHLAHLRTVIEADLGDRTLSEAILALHPTPAVCGLPVAEARAFIRAHEQHDRGLYTGFWGPWKPDGRTDLFVNIRTVHIGDGHATLYVGAGITAGSDPGSEWSETEQKSRTWLDLIQAMQ